MKDAILLEVLWKEINVLGINGDDFISLTDIARYKNPNEPKDVVKNWLKTRNTIDFLWLWETINNPGFKGAEFDPFKTEAGTNAFTLSPQKWIEATNAVWIISKSWKGWWTYAHKDIALEFASWISINYRIQMKSLVSLEVSNKFLDT